MILASKACASSGVALGYTWVAVGASGLLATSTSSTASSWTARTSSFGTTVINDVAADGVNYFVAVGASGKLATSPDATTWTQRTSSFSTDEIRRIVYANGIWVAAGANGKLATATDPTGTWTQRTTGFGTGAAIMDIQYGNGIWVAETANGDVRTATDPTGTWTLRTNATGFGAFCNSRGRWCPAPGIFVMGVDPTTNSNLQTATDGITWTNRSLPNATLAVGPQARITSTTSVIVVAYNLSSGSSTCDIATSTDGTSYTDRTPAVTAQLCGGAATDGATIVLGMAANTVQTSSDGITWTSRTGPTFETLGLCHSSNV